MRVPALILLTATVLVGCARVTEFRYVKPMSGAVPAPTTPTAQSADFTAQEALGRQIFFDSRLSEPQGVSCASCHDSASAFTGNHGSSIAAVALGSTPGSFGARNVPTITYAAFNMPFGFYPGDQDDFAHPGTLSPFGGQFWDGRALNLSAQAAGPLLAANEMNNPSKAAVVAKIQSGTYTDLFQTVCGTDIYADSAAAFSCLSEALAAFQQSPVFQPFTSKFDAYLRGNAQLTTLESRGFALFKDPAKGNCLSCHTGNVSSQYPRSWLFTDHGFDAIGAPRNANIPANANAAYFDLGLCQQPGLASLAPLGFDINGTCGAFKTPTLRNVALTAPYGHNGQFQTLTDVVRFYATRDTNPELWYSRDGGGLVVKFDDMPPQYRTNINMAAPFGGTPGGAPSLDAGEIAAIVAFLETLTDGYVSRTPPAAR